jgi:hypothetical protein
MHETDLFVIYRSKTKLGLNYKTLKTIYLGVILPLLPYDDPVRCKAMTLESCKAKLLRFQTIINIKIAKPVIKKSIQYVINNP